MCGRTACTLEEHHLVKACGYTARDGSTAFPQWLDTNPCHTYTPGYNKAPGSSLAVLTQGSLVNKVESENSVVLCPMRWGLVPRWYNGSLQDFHLSTANCRTEDMLSKPTYRPAISHQQRCVVLADGYYEWKKVGPKGKKQPYLIYFPQSVPFWNTQDPTGFWCEEKGWMGPRLLTMAGIFDIFSNPNMDPLYSFSVLTMDASSKVSSIHHRMPAILDGPEEVAQWLDISVSFAEAFSSLKPCPNLDFHPVSTVVNDSRNNTPDCLLPLKTSSTPSSNLLTSWLKRPPQSDASSTDQPPNKICKH